MFRTLLTFFLATSGIAQVNYGLQAGISATVGTHVTGLGVFARSYMNYDFIQFNHTVDIQLSRFSYGNRRNLFEVRNAFGLLFGFGSDSKHISVRQDGLAHQLNHQFALGYNYVIYTDNRQSSQLSGGFGLHLGRFSIMHENDVFGGQAKDRFRTAHFRINWSDSVLNLGFGTNLWTGETANTEWQKVTQEKMPNGYRSLEETLYGHSSHGISYAEVSYNGPYQQSPTLRLGVDSEEIRHFLQNRLFHDLIFLPKSLARNTPHYPRLDEHGCMVFSKEERRKDRLYLQLGTNDYLFH